ncbi:magnesium chelatase subunit D [Rhodothalassium salexigens]|uniref:magnesium chelatase subunit D n=1 Tax=Rhodothalassium salexigens TaxID=1086 RepID=UPI0019134738|nr:magnesium chelatase subunit D [Rhodothalassium salexigens]
MANASNAPATDAPDAAAMAAAGDDAAEARAAVWTDAAMIAALIAVDPAGLGGVHIKAWPSPVRHRWLDLMKEMMGPGRPFRWVPVSAPESRLLGGLDLTATLEAGRPMVAKGLLAEADGGVLVATMAERMATETAARITQTMDRGAVTLERDGLTRQFDTRFGLIALDESDTDEDGPPAALLDRLAFSLTLEGLRHDDDLPALFLAEEVAAARQRLPKVTIGDPHVEALCRTAAALAIGSIRAELLAVRAACASAALDGRREVDEDDALLAARLVLSHRARALPAPPQQEDEEQQPPPPPPEDDAQTDEPETPPDLPDQPDEAEADTDRDDLADNAGEEDRMVDAAQAAIPQDLLNRLIAGQGARAANRSAKGKQKKIAGARRGRPTGTRRGMPGGGERLNVIETLRSAAPWQPLRRAQGQVAHDGVQVRADDFRLTKFKQRAETTSIFVVDASGSAALARLAEAKGAVEILLADCYVRRDEVALVAFRGTKADVLLPPTRSSARAKRSLSALPGGGGTPLALGLDAALGVAEGERRRGRRPIVVVLSDGGANIDRAGEAGRAQAKEDALKSAQAMRAAGVQALFVDTSERGRMRGKALAREVAAAMGAEYLPLPAADARALSTAVRARTPADGQD